MAIRASQIDMSGKLGVCGENIEDHSRYRRGSSRAAPITILSNQFKSMLTGFVLQRHAVVLWSTILTIFTSFSFSTISLARADALQAYVSRLGPPSNMEVKERDAGGPTRITFQSQVWREIPWRHELIIKNPAKLQRQDFIAIILTGGDGGADPQNGALQLANALGIRAAVLTKVPNQPLFGGRKEDLLLSYTLDQYRRSGDSSWPLLFPMVGSVVKGIDTLAGALNQPDLKVILIGASKRGWTTYLAGAVDKRIAAIIPAVFEMVSMQKQIALARSRYGADSEKIRAYTALGLTDSLLEPRVSELVSWVDPTEHFRSLTMPKLILLGANDPYWVVDSVRLYWNNLPEPKMLRILPNVGHGVLGESLASETIISFIRQVLARKSTPQVAWRFSSASNGKALVTGESAIPLVRCLIWQATSTELDFRKTKFSSNQCQVLEGGKKFKAIISLPGTENTALFADLETTANSRGERLFFSTESHVYPATR